ncbi:hypothetical protein [Streptomyces lydicamycinicus]|uniref:hypothetical protein n=1 Tax=Streptomyces lydicamycinicus TaxID=1546107 RepID=UPI003C2E2897
MSTRLNASDLRTLAAALDALSQTTRDTGVSIDRYGEQHITYHDHVIRADWEPGADEASGGQYVIEMPDTAY